MMGFKMGEKVVLTVVQIEIESGGKSHGRGGWSRGGVHWDGHQSASFISDLDGAYE